MRVHNKWVAKFLEDRSGQDLLEYALVASLIALATVAALNPVGNAVASVFISAIDSLVAAFQ